MPPESFKTLLISLKDALETENQVQIPGILSEYHSEVSDWHQFAVHDNTVAYTRNKLLSIPSSSSIDCHYCQILLLIWKPQCGSQIHNHPNSECWVKLLSGQMEEIVYYDNNINTPTVKNIVENDVTHINDSIGLHSMHNLSTSEYAVTLHVYTATQPLDIYMDFQKSFS